MQYSVRRSDCADQMCQSVQVNAAFFPVRNAAHTRLGILSLPAGSDANNLPSGLGQSRCCVLTEKTSGPGNERTLAINALPSPFQHGLVRGACCPCLLHSAQFPADRVQNGLWGLHLLGTMQIFRPDQPLAPWAPA